MTVSPHADDVEIGMGGTIAKLIDEGHQVKVLVVIIPCEDASGRVHGDMKEMRWREAEISAEYLGVELEILDLDPYEFKFDRKNTKIFDKITKDFNPQKIFIPWEFDSHQDHQNLAKIMFVATRKNTASLYMYETMMPGGISSHSFKPQLFMDITRYIEQKDKSMRKYRSVFGSQHDIFEGILGRARFRGNQIGVKYAEAFEIVKEIIY